MSVWKWIPITLSLLYFASPYSQETEEFDPYCASWETEFSKATNIYMVANRWTLCMSLLATVVAITC